MAHGLPDFYRGVDIAYQALAQMIVRPKYGGAVFYSGSKVVTPNGTTTLMSVAGKGMLYGGAIHLAYTATQRYSYPAVNIDGSSTMGATFDFLNKYGLNKHGGYMLSLSKYDDVNFVYCVEISYGITFEESILIKYVEAHGGTPQVFYRICYALV